VILAQAARRLKEHGSLEEAAGMFDHVIFCANVTYADGGFKGGQYSRLAVEGTILIPTLTDLTSRVANEDQGKLKTQQELAGAWKDQVPNFDPDNVHVLPSIEHAVQVVRDLGSDEVQVLVTGSLHLVGGVIEVAGLSEVAL
jgi:folylpolyglutamate synthase